MSDDMDIYSDDIRYKNVTGIVAKTPEDIIKIVKQLLGKKIFVGNDILCLLVDKTNTLILHPKVEGKIVLSLHLVAPTDMVLLKSIGILKPPFEELGVKPIHIAGICTRQEDCHYKGFFSVPKEHELVVSALLESIKKIDARTIIDQIFLE